MKKIMLIIIGLIVITPAIMFASSAVKAQRESSEGGIFVPGNFVSMAVAQNNTVYLLTKDHKLVQITSKGAQKTIRLPKLTAKPNEEASLCDMAVDSSNLLFCGYSFSEVFSLNLKNPNAFKRIKLQFEGSKVKPLMISAGKNSWYLKDSEERVLQVLRNGAASLMPQYTEIEPRNSDSVQIAPPEYSENGVVYNDKVFINGKTDSLLWQAPKPSEPKVVLGVEFLGQDKNRRDIFKVITGAGELNQEVTVYAVKDQEIVAQRVITDSPADGIMRYCRLAPDGSLVLLQKDPEGRKGVLLKRLNLNTNKPAAG